MTETVTTEDYRRYRISPVWPDRWSHAALVKALLVFDERHALAFELEEIGKSVEGRAIYEARIGNGKKRVLLWSQMHGDEPTHTAVLMDLLNFLLTDPKHLVAKSLLSECRLHLIIMLNPDGAERDTRRNAQDIDINRDARDLQTPEGRILWDAVKRVKPQFAFNLHNHNPRATAGIEPKPAAVALLAPPIDQANTESETVRRAKQLVMTFANGVAEECPGMVARYNADYIERAFGEAVQKSGAATMLIEVGGWPTLDATSLAEVHFLGLVRTLHAIATGKYLQAEAADYDKLPVSGRRELFDLMIQNVSVVDGAGHPAFRADIGINLIGYMGKKSGCKTATIADLGDLKITTGKEIVRGDNLTCYPGFLTYQPGITPTHLPGIVEIIRFLERGITTVIGSVDLSNEEDVIEFEKLRNGTVAVNLGFVGDASGLKGTDMDEERNRFLRVVGHGLLGVLDSSLPSHFANYCQWLRVPLVSRNALAKFISLDFGRDVKRNQRAREMYEELGLNTRGTVRLGATADLAIFQNNSLERIFVGGNDIDVSTPSLFRVGQLLRRLETE